MPNKKVQYKKSLKKQLWTIIVISIGLMALTFSLNMHNEWQFYIWLVLFTLVTVIVFLLLKQQSNEAFCPYCKTDLFALINHAGNNNIEINYCPVCGKEIEL